jgi:hypothetical protein
MTPPHEVGMFARLDVPWHGFGILRPLFFGYSLPESSYART